MSLVSQDSAGRFRSPSLCLSLDDLVIPTLASLVPCPNHTSRRWPSQQMVDKAKRPSASSGRLTAQPKVAKAKPPKVDHDRAGIRWDRQAVRAVAVGIRLLDRTDPQRLQRIAQARIARRKDRERKVAEAVARAPAAPVTSGPSEAELAARKAAALANAAAMVALMRAPHPT